MSSDEVDTKREKMNEAESKEDESKSGSESDTVPEPVKANNKVGKKKAAAPKIKAPAKKRVKAEQAEKQAEKDAKDEEKKKDSKKKVEESDEENDQEPDNDEKTNGIKKGVPLLDQPLEISGSRERKQVQRFHSIESEKKEQKGIIVPEGSGKTLSEIPRIDNNLQRYKAESIKNLHKICFNQAGKILLIKKNVRKFNGFDFDKDSPEYEKKKQMISKYGMNDLKTICTILDLERSKKKEDLVELILKFLLKPVDSGKPVPEGRSKRKNALLKSYDESDSEPDPNQKKKRSLKTKGKKKSVKEVSEGSGSEKDEPNDKEDEEAEDSKSEDESDDEPKQKKAKKAPAKPKEKKSAAPPKKRAAAKRAAMAKKKKADESEEEDDVAESGNDSDEGDDEPLVKKGKTPPTEDEIKAYVKSILEGANLEEITMKTVCKQVYSHYPEFDLGHKKDFIKTTVKSLISS